MNFTDKKIAFFTEMPFIGKVGRDHIHMRTEFAQMCAMEVDHYSYYNLERLFTKHTGYDHVIMLVSKTTKLRDWMVDHDLMHYARYMGKKVWFMQEATCWIHQTMKLHHQINHYNLLNEVDGILAENFTDFEYYRGIAPEKPVHVIPTLMIEKPLLNARKVEKEDKSMIGGNCNSWYGGFDSYLVASHFKNKISVPKMRNVENENQLDNLEILPHIKFREWIYHLASYKYAVHLMPSVTAGTFSLNCSFLGIPCIGYKQSDTQRLCQPDLSVDHWDLEKAMHLAKRLKEDDKFYKHCSETAIENYNKHFNEEVFIKHMRKVLS
tara:strand:- start:219 stop:1187 length:969 start_codon:yes stop_codon:yes gene_type:complete